MPQSNEIQKRLDRLNDSLSQNHSLTTKLRRWSEFIRFRDGERCVGCHEKRKLAAHHIVRKSLFKEAKLLTGNGITLCKACHSEVHKGFNGRPDLSLPMDMQGGEKIETIDSLYTLLLVDAREREVDIEEFYFFTDSILAKFKMLQGFEPDTYFPGNRLEQAALIWSQCPLDPLNAVLSANGLPTRSAPILPGITIKPM